MIKMGDITAVTTKPKEGVSTVTCPMLSSSNYTLWAIRMKNLLKIHKVWEIIEDESNDSEKNDMAIGLLFTSIPEALVLQIGDSDTAKKVWEAIKGRYLGAERVREARLCTLSEEFDKLKMKETESIDDFVGKLTAMTSKSVALGETIDEPKMVKKFLKSLPRKKYIQIIASIEQMLDLKKEKFEDMVGHLKAYEERIKDDDDDGHSEQNKLMYANSETQQGTRDGEYKNMGRGRGPYG